MACPEYENQILDYQEQSLPPGARPKLEAHLAACVVCRTFLHDLVRLETRLENDLPRPALPGDFSARVLRRIDIAELSPILRETRKKFLEAEFQAAGARFASQTRWYRAARLLHVLDYGLAAALAGILLLGAAKYFSIAQSSIGNSLQGHSLHVAWIGCLVILGVAFGLALKAKLPRWITGL